MSPPSTRRTDIASVLRLVACATARALLRGVGRVDLLHFDAQTCSFVADEQRQLREAPTIFHAVVFAGFRPTTGACRALAYPRKRLYFDGANALLLGMIDDLTGKLVVDILHPTRFFALAFLDGTGFLRLLQLLASGIEASPHVPLIAPIAEETGSFAPDMGDRRNFDAQVNAHDAFLLGSHGVRLGHRDIGNPFAPFLLDAQDPRPSCQLHLAVVAKGNGIYVFLNKVPAIQETDNSSSGGLISVTLHASTAEGEVAFNNMKVWTL